MSLPISLIAARHNSYDFIIKRESERERERERERKRERERERERKSERETGNLH